MKLTELFSKKPAAPQPTMPSAVALARGLNTGDPNVGQLAERFRREHQIDQMEKHDKEGVYHAQRFIRSLAQTSQALPHVRENDGFLEVVLRRTLRVDDEVTRSMKRRDDDVARVPKLEAQLSEMHSRYEHDLAHHRAEHEASMAQLRRGLEHELEEANARRATAESRLKSEHRQSARYAEELEAFVEKMRPRSPVSRRFSTCPSDDTIEPAPMVQLGRPASFGPGTDATH